VTAYELIRRVATKGGELRIASGHVQYRPADVLNGAELRWLSRNTIEVARALVSLVAAPERVH